MEQFYRGHVDGENSDVESWDSNLMTSGVNSDTSLRKHQQTNLGSIRPMMDQYAPSTKLNMQDALRLNPGKQTNLPPARVLTDRKDVKQKAKLPQKQIDQFLEKQLQFEAQRLEHQLQLKEKVFKQETTKPIVAKGRYAQNTSGKRIVQTRPRNQSSNGQQSHKQFIQAQNQYKQLEGPKRGSIKNLQKPVLDQFQRKPYYQKQELQNEFTFQKKSVGKNGTRIPSVDRINDELSMSAAVIEEILDEFPETMPSKVNIKKLPVIADSPLRLPLTNQSPINCDTEEGVISAVNKKIQNICRVPMSSRLHLSATMSSNLEYGISINGSVLQTPSGLINMRKQIEKADIAKSSSQQKIQPFRQRRESTMASKPKYELKPHAKVEENKKKVAEIALKIKEEAMQSEYQLNLVKQKKEKYKNTHDETLRQQKFAKEFDFLVPESQLNFPDFKKFLINFGLVNTPDLIQTPDYKLTYELWKSVATRKNENQSETVQKKLLLNVVQAIVGLLPSKRQLQRYDIAEAVPVKQGESKNRPNSLPARSSSSSKHHHVMGPANPSTSYSKSKELVYYVNPTELYPDEEPVYEVSSITMSSCDFEELKGLQVGFLDQPDENISLTPQEVDNLKHRFRSFSFNWRLNTRKREKLIDLIKQPPSKNNDYTPKINPLSEALMQQKDDRVKVWDRQLRRRAQSIAIHSNKNQEGEQGSKSNLVSKKSSNDSSSLRMPIVLNADAYQTIKLPQKRARSSSIAVKKSEQLLSTRLIENINQHAKKLNHRSDLHPHEREFREQRFECTFRPRINSVLHRKASLSSSEKPAFDSLSSVSAQARSRRMKIAIEKDIERHRNAQIANTINAQVKDKGGRFQDYDQQSGQKKQLPSSLTQLTQFQKLNRVGVPLDKEGDPITKEQKRRPSLPGRTKSVSKWEQKLEDHQKEVKGIMKSEKPVICIDIKILNQMERINVYKDDNPKDVVEYFCKKHGLLPSTEQYLLEKVQHYKTRALRKKQAKNQDSKQKKSVKIAE